MNRLRMLIKSVSSTLLLLFCSTAAQAFDAQAKAADPLSFSSIFSVFSALLFVLAMLFAAAWLLKRLQRVQMPAAGAAIQVVSQLQLGIKERVLLLRVGDENVLIGCTPGSLRSLHVWSGNLPQSTQSLVSAQPQFLDTIKAVLAERKK